MSSAKRAADLRQRKALEPVDALPRQKLPIAPRLRRSFQPELANFVRIHQLDPMSMGRQQAVMRELWKRLGPEMPDYPAKYMPRDEAEAARFHHKRLSPFPMFQNVHAYEAIGEAAREQFPKRFNDQRRAVSILDNEYGIFPKLMKDPETVVRNVSGSYALGFNNDDGSLIRRSTYVAQQLRNGNAVATDDAVWLYLPKHGPGGGPIEHAILWQLIYQANGTPPAQDHIAIAGEAIYQLGNESSLAPRVHQLVGVHWRADPWDDKGFVRVADWDAGQATNPEVSFAPQLGNTAMLALSRQLNP